MRDNPFVNGLVRAHRQDRILSIAYVVLSGLAFVCWLVCAAINIRDCRLGEAACNPSAHVIDFDRDGRDFAVCGETDAGFRVLEVRR